MKFFPVLPIIFAFFRLKYKQNILKNVKLLYFGIRGNLAKIQIARFFKSYKAKTLQFKLILMFLNTDNQLVKSF